MRGFKDIIELAVRISGHFRLTSKFLIGGLTLAALLIACTSYLLYSIAISITLLEEERSALEQLHEQTSLWSSFLPAPSKTSPFKTIDKKFTSNFSKAFKTTPNDARPHHLTSTIKRLSKLNANPSFENQFITYLVLSHSILERIQEESHRIHVASNDEISASVRLLYTYFPYILDNTARQLAVLATGDSKLHHYIVGLEFIVLDGLQRVNENIKTLQNHHVINNELYSQLLSFSDELESFQANLAFGSSPPPPNIEKGIFLLEQLRLATLKKMDEKISTQRGFFIKTLLSIIALIIALALIGAGTVLGITRSLKMIEVTSKLFRAGHLDARIHLKSSDEFFRISDNFNKIAENFNLLLTQQQEKNLTYQISLEDQVKKRTTELALTNQELSIAIETLKSAQDKIIEREKMAALGTLVAGVAHEINTPIGLAYTAATHLRDKFNQLLILRTPNTDSLSSDRTYSAMQNSLHYAISNLERASSLIESFKQVAVDRSHDNLRQFNISKTLAEISRTLSPILRNGAHQIQIITSTAINIESLPGAFGQVITNIVLNAVTHAFDGIQGGTIKIEANMVDSNTLMVLISDDGRGMPPEICGRVFDPFFTTKRGRGGSGLGLHISWNLVTQKLGGHISCSSSLGTGSTFTLTLPKTLGTA